MSNARTSIDRAIKQRVFVPHRLAAEAILCDIMDRKGVKSAFGDVDPRVMETILCTWSEIIKLCNEGE